jgi:isochorismate hydrolase
MPDYLEEVRRYNIRTHTIEPDRCALLVIDMQEYFGGIARGIRENVLKIIETCRGAGMFLVFTRHGHKDIEKDGGMLDKWWGDNIMVGAPSWELMAGIEPGEGELLLDKNRYSAFFNTSLDEALRARGVEQVLITGVMTNCCCETTAREAFVRDYRVFFVSDATATVNDELHIATLKTLAYGFAHIVVTETVLSLGM